MIYKIYFSRECSEITLPVCIYFGGEKVRGKNINQFIFFVFHRSDENMSFVEVWAWGERSSFGRRRRWRQERGEPRVALTKVLMYPSSPVLKMIHLMTSAAWHFKCKFVLCCWWSPVDKGFGLTMALRIPSQVATRHCPSRVDTNAANAVITAIAISWGVTIYFYTAAQTSSCAIRSLETVHVGTLLNWRPLGICTLFTC